MQIVMLKVDFANYFSKLSVDFRTLELSQRLLETFWFSFAI